MRKLRFSCAEHVNCPVPELFREFLLASSYFDFTFASTPNDLTPDRSRPHTPSSDIMSSHLHSSQHTFVVTGMWEPEEIIMKQLEFPEGLLLVLLCHMTTTDIWRIEEMYKAV